MGTEQTAPATAGSSFSGQKTCFSKGHLIETNSLSFRETEGGLGYKSPYQGNCKNSSLVSTFLGQLGKDIPTVETCRRHKPLLTKRELQDDEGIVLPSYPSNQKDPPSAVPVGPHFHGCCIYGFNYPRIIVGGLTSCGPYSGLLTCLLAQSRGRGELLQIYSWAGGGSKGPQGQNSWDGWKAVKRPLASGRGMPFWPSLPPFTLYWEGIDGQGRWGAAAGGAEH